MKNILLILTMLFCTFFSNGQNRQLKGHVFYQNSGKKPATGVKVSGTGANPIFSSESGEFALLYAYKKAGDIAGLSIGTTDKNNILIEVVNRDALEITRIAANPEDQVSIFVCRAGQIAEAKMRYYEISQTKLSKDYQRMIKEKDKLLARNNNTKEEKMQIQRELDSINVQYKKALERIEELAEFLALINKDFASSLVLEAIEKIEMDHDVEGALKILDGEKLNAAYQSAVVSKQKAESAIDNVIQGYLLKISLLKPVFKFDEVIECYNKLIEIEIANRNEKGFLSSYYNHLASAYDNSGQPLKALECRRKLIPIIEEVFGTHHYKTASVYGGLSNSLFYLGDYVNALVAGKYALSISEKLSPAPDSLLSTQYNGIACIYLGLGEPQNALTYAMKSFEIDSRLYSRNDPVRAVHDCQLSATYFALEKYDSAKKYQLEALRIDKLDGERGKIKTAKEYTFLGRIEQRLGDTAKAEQDVKLGVKIAEEYFSKTSTHLATFYEGAAYVYLEQKRFKDALEYQAKAVEIGEASGGSRNLMMAERHLTMALIHAGLGDLKKAESYHLKQISALEYTVPEKVEKIASAYTELALTMQVGKEFLKAIHYYEKSNEVLKNTKKAKTMTDINLMRIGVCYYFLREYNKAISFYGQVQNSTADDVQRYLLSNLGLAYIKDGKFKQAEKTFSDYLNRGSDKGFAYRNWALYSALKNDAEGVIRYIELAQKSGYRNVKWFEEESAFDWIRNDSKFKSVMEEMFSKQ